MLPFEHREYQERIRKAKERMAAQEIDTLIVADPANMHYLTGYDGWSFYTPQVVVVGSDDEEPVCVVRGMDANGAKLTTFLDPSNIIGYPDHYVQSDERHPMEYVAETMRLRGLDRGSIGLEMDAYYFSPAGYEALKNRLPEARFRDCRQLVNWVRAIKSPREIVYMEQAARIMERTMRVAIEMVRPGVRQCDAAAAIYGAQISGTAEFGGDYTAFVPMLPTGVGTSTPHLTWSDRPFVGGEATILELAASRLHYHCPMARTVFLGKPSQSMVDTAAIVAEGTHAAIAAARPGATCEDVEAAWRRVIARRGLVKESRIGYSVGLNFPPDWGEHTMSLRPGDKTVLQPNMTLHVIPGIWMDAWGIEISECIQITERGARTLANFPRDLVIKN